MFGELKFSMSWYEEPIPFSGAFYHPNNNFVIVLVVVIFVVIIIRSLIIGKRWLGSDCHRDFLLATIPGYPPRSHPSADGNQDY